MKIPQKTITVILSDPDGDAVLTFERLRENEREKLIAMLADARPKKGEETDETRLTAAFTDYRKALLAKCISVSNLFEGDRPVTVEDVKSGMLYTDVVEQIYMGLQAAMTQKGEAEQKNENSQSEPLTGSDIAS